MMYRLLARRTDDFTNTWAPWNKHRVYVSQRDANDAKTKIHQMNRNYRFKLQATNEDWEDLS